MLAPMHMSIRPWEVVVGGLTAVVAGLSLLGVADSAYVTHVTGVYLDSCEAGQYGASTGPSQAHACYPVELGWLYWCATAGAALFALGFGLLSRQSIVRLRKAGGWELGLRSLLHLLAVPALAYAALEVLLRGMWQSVWRSGCWICPAPLPPTAPDPYPAFDAATLTLTAAGLVSLSIALATFAVTIKRIARRRSQSPPLAGGGGA